MFFDQAEYNIRCEWGTKGIEHIGISSDVVIIVDVISFSTAVDIVTAQGAQVFPYAKNEGIDEFAKRMDAIVVGPRSKEHTLVSLESLEANRLVLPYPNEAVLSILTGQSVVLAGCLRNAQAVAQAAMKLGTTIAVIPAGEHWADKSARFATEDLIGAGAILSFLEGSFSPEAQSAVAIYEDVKDNVCEHIKKCSSGKKLIEQGFADDVLCACQVNVSSAVPQLIDVVYRNIA